MDTVERVLTQYEPDDFVYDVRDARDADESERVFFTPMLIVSDAVDPNARTVVVGDLLQSEVLNGLLQRYGLRSRIDQI